MKDTKSHSVMECYKADARIAELEAENAKLRAALEKVEWVSGWDVEGRKAVYCPWCNRIKGFGHTLDCARQSALRQSEGGGE